MVAVMTYVVRKENDMPNFQDPIEQLRASFWSRRNPEGNQTLEELQVLALLQIASELRALRSQLAPGSNG